MFPLRSLVLWRPASLRGAGLLFTPFLLLFALGGCSVSEAGNSEADRAELQALGLSPRAGFHRITLGGRGSEEHAVPTRIHAFPGDAVEFRTVDHRVHTLVFPVDSLASDVRAFLETTGQISSPPLVTRGSRFILNLQNAPPGSYPFVSGGHGGEARGTVQVGDPSTSDVSRT